MAFQYGETSEPTAAQNKISISKGYNALRTRGKSWSLRRCRIQNQALAVLYLLFIFIVTKFDIFWHRIVNHCILFPDPQILIFLSSTNMILIINLQASNINQLEAFPAMDMDQLCWMTLNYLCLYLIQYLQAISTSTKL